MSKSLKQLYNNLILDRQKDNAGFEKRDDADIILEAYNPLCGDQFKLYLNFEGNQVSQATYYGYGCALSKASTSLLIEGLAGKSYQECIDLIDSFFYDLTHEDPKRDALIKALSMAQNFPGRQQCTVLSWEALHKYITDNKLISN
jgi:nitrogen fixation NifU-like protein